MPTRLIDGVTVKPLRVIPDERGYLFEMLRSDEPIFQKFGQTYVTAIYPGVIKAWHYHKKQTDHFVCVHGMAKVVLYDDREDSPTRGLVNEFFMGERNMVLLVIPRLVWHGMKGVGTDTTLIVNTPTEPYSAAEPDEYRKPYDTPDIPYDWALKHG
jgi:dTDP-4-dehydrorhamnose 3,5-epimerase